MTGRLTEFLRRRIALTGPLTVAEFMGEALGHPEHGYYTTRDPLGVAGDFTTAPEISQMFGELIGLWCAEVWRTSISPSPVHLVELGPGRGSLMADALHAARIAPDFAAAITVHLVETSPVLADIQRRTLAGQDVLWHASIDAVPNGPIIVIANEFFDALPVHQFVRTDTGWRERVVGLDADNQRFVFGLGQGAGPELALIPDEIRRSTRVGELVEVCPSGAAIVGTIANRIGESGGAALIVDYGHTASAPGETLQAVQRHGRHDPLDAPGTADLTTHVDFALLMSAARKAGAFTHGPVPQGAFLTRLGIAHRAEMLMKGASEPQIRDIEAAQHRLIAPQEMGTLFKVLALTRSGTPVPPGFGDTSRTASAR